ncbi:hypothetical protein A2276_05425 [candidate division WOR-1 bacterium RIFOXYA12_FULL_43_27]|uniref:Uncharacterized protein n=1 Tax=candidate division WOR-1 bacterium RIFOXYC2_FULL_46_14 TaxID=1802587 RepID=A0A1F4U3X2_UNCSA|nr:MAG: hypothetical protein A2276_05425 [candidate division WOR-1 bacterium RIFOXYA12_FULL_43_27]OGC20106.1 MAG: hypothetical protein A2292_03430 [candidate division WOR-1 bacterium RIFOXYB2_FULL_46_45]OGC32157.1 MAG: hypothetical protein A2232_08020 [candidate division WOR-1 bacterium RIFOXYA2_FULL_46_56]OGC39557.1 MAG: hypothetical protein A2438_08385 [candidate division WOR-1 bacterium RIFOXYC2_FULL_46_14]
MTRVSLKPFTLATIVTLKKCLDGGKGVTQCKAEAHKAGLEAAGQAKIPGKEIVGVDLLEASARNFIEIWPKDPMLKNCKKAQKGPATLESYLCHIKETVERQEKAQRKEAARTDQKAREYFGKNLDDPHAS